MKAAANQGPIPPQDSQGKPTEGAALGGCRLHGRCAEEDSMKWLGYDSNNSGGGWWLKDADWKALGAAGWTVFWKDGRWLGALATSAAKQFATAKEGIAEFERITGADVGDEGCNCCGPPHSFVFGETKDGEAPKDFYQIVGRSIGCDDFRVVSRKELDE